MKYTTMFRFTALTISWLYCAALAQAGQVVSQTERDWAKQALEQEQTLTTQGVTSAPNSLAVLYFNNRSGQGKLTPLQKGMAVMLITDLAKVEQLRVVERVRMQALLDELDLGSSGLVATESAPRVGKLLGVAKVTSGDIQEGTAQELELSSSILDIPLDQLARQPSAAGALDELFRLEKEILFHIVEYMQITLSPQKRAELKRPLSKSTPALLALFLGIDYSDRALYNLAAKMYKQALAEDPSLAMAKSALQELKDMGLIRSEEVAEQGEPSEPAVESQGGISTGTVIGVGLGLAAAGAGAVYLLNDDGGDDTTEQAPAEGPTVTDIPFTTPLSCAQGGIRFQFSRDMDTSVGQVDINSPSGFEASGGWDGDYYFSWSQNYRWCTVNCEGGCTLTVMLTDFQDTEGNTLSGTTTFSYDME
ncbi:MAG: CsgG/HfaB family protein [Candidatus Electrothrix sp. GW3-4]|uniref:CsgG/HfaB family protein n=1 Tax=Candidatus Electrothrix sp. GW3-4 TaxID=3126740 RepID=UPI0030CCE153